MKKKLAAIVVAFVMTVALAACGAGKETTLTGMVVSVDGTVISLMEMDSEMSGMNFGSGEISQMPEGMEDFQGFGSFDPENFDPESFQGFGGFDGTMPEGGDFSQWGSGEMPEGMTPPEGMELPEGMTVPEDGQMPGFGGMGGMDFSDFASDAETKTVDIADAHISVEIDGGKASGSMDDITAGTFVTITMNGKGQVTNVVVSSMSGLGGRIPTN